MAHEPDQVQQIMPTLARQHNRRQCWGYVEQKYQYQLKVQGPCGGGEKLRFTATPAKAYLHSSIASLALQ